MKKKPKRRPRQAVRRDGREPLGLGAAIGMMMTERGLVAPAAGGSVLARWETILAAAAPEFAGHVAAVAFDADSGRLDVVPDSPAYGTKLRWTTQKLISAANADVPDANVRALHVLPPAAATAGPATAAADTTPDAPLEAAGPVRTREDACDGYRQALAAHQAAKAQQGDRLSRRRCAPRSSVKPKRCGTGAIRKKPSAMGRPRSRNCASKRPGRRHLQAPGRGPCSASPLSGPAASALPRVSGVRRDARGRFRDVATAQGGYAVVWHIVAALIKAYTCSIQGVRPQRWRAGGWIPVPGA